MDQEIKKFMETFQQLSNYSQELMCAQVQLALVAENAMRRQYGLPPESSPGQESNGKPAA